MKSLRMLCIDADAAGLRVCRPRVGAGPCGSPAGWRPARHVGRGHHRVHARERPARAAVSRPVEADVTVNITYLVGSRHENYGETGMAHLLEHLLFKGSPKHPDIPKELQDHGARPNGTTWFDRTNYFETFPATDENLEWALDLEADRMVNSFVAKKDLDSEMTVVRNEFEAGENNPLGVLYQRVISTAYLWHNYGKSTIGSRADIENVPIERLQAFYRKYYQPDNAMLVVAGKFDEAKTLGLVGEVLRRRSRGRSGRCPTHLHRSSRRRTASARSRCGASATCRTSSSAITCRPARTPTSRPCSWPRRFSPTTARRAGSTRRWSRRRRRPTSAVKGSSCATPGMWLLLMEVRKESSLDDARDTLLATVDAREDDAVHQRRSRAREESLLSGIELQFNNSEQMALAPQQLGLDGRLAALLPESRPPQAGHARRRAARRARTTRSPPTARSGSSFRPSSRIGPRSPRRRTSSRSFKDYKGNAAVAAGEVFDAVAGEHRVAAAAHVAARRRRRSCCCRSRRAATRCRRSSGCRSATRSRWPDSRGSRR